mmetsp:Transcript_68868/g.161944  ORF Transcript_68868/g.161944 Transcript_68868/m.161944 type:complete len:204 (-) Transcript_68868:736-1347(-)
MPLSTMCQLILTTASRVTMIGVTCGDTSISNGAANTRAEVAECTMSLHRLRRLHTSSTGLCPCPLPHRFMLFTCRSRRPTTGSTTATPGIPTGISDGPATRRVGAAHMHASAARGHGTAATTRTCTSRMASAMLMGASTTARRGGRIGCKDGLIPRRTGAAATRRRAASSTTALGMLGSGLLRRGNGAVATSRKVVLRLLYRR